MKAMHLVLLSHSIQIIHDHTMLHHTLLMAYHSSPFFLVLFVCLVRVSADLRRLSHPPKADGSVSLLVVGDWGRRGKFNQSQVAAQMGNVGHSLDIDFVVSTGDNFYDDGLSSAEDPQFRQSFSDVYTAPSLQRQWYTVLGNHDYRGNVEAQLSPILSHTDARWLCLRSFVVDAETADLFFVDTTPFVDKYFVKPKRHHYDWRGVLPRDDYLSDLLRDLRLSLANSVAQWKIVIGHHTIKSIGHHRATKELTARLLPVLEAHNVDMYINGHDHCLQHISSDTSEIQFLTSGGGSKAWKGDIDTLNVEGVEFYYDGQGFLSLQLTRTDAKIMFHDVFGKVVHDFHLSKQLYSTL